MLSPKMKINSVIRPSTLIVMLVLIFQSTQAQQLESQLGILNLTANGGINPATGAAWEDGDTYRLIFVSSTSRDATSSDIADYNTHIQNAANAAGLGKVSWYAIGSTNAVDARDNTFTTSSDTDGAIMLINGTQIVANNIADLWDGAVDTQIDFDENGNPTSVSTPIWTPYTAVWTGTTGNGTGHSSRHLGAGTVLHGLAKAELQFWEQRSQNSNTNSLPFYGISEVLKVREAGGAGIIHVTGDPNNNLDLNTMSPIEANIAYDANTQILYFYSPLGTDYDGITAGTHWLAVEVSNLVDPIKNILTPELELTTSIVDGVATITFESNASMSYASGTNVLTYTDVDGDDTSVTLESLADVEADNPSITITGAGSSSNPYQVGLTGANLAGNAGLVPVTNGTTGALTWTNAIDNVTVNSDGQIVLSPTNSVTPLALNMNPIPEVENITTLNAAAIALPAGETGVAKSASTNTFGMPATSASGVFFFISN